MVKTTSLRANTISDSLFYLIIGATTFFGLLTSAVNHLLYVR